MPILFHFVVSVTSTPSSGPVWRGDVNKRDEVTLKIASKHGDRDGLDFKMVPFLNSASLRRSSFFSGRPAVILWVSLVGKGYNYCH